MSYTVHNVVLVHTYGVARVVASFCLSLGIFWRGFLVGCSYYQNGTRRKRKRKE
jgi:hypothetical protein